MADMLDDWWGLVSAENALVTVVAVLVAVKTVQWAYARLTSYNRTRVGKEYEYIVVGSGPAGCVVAHRLAKWGGSSVLVLEAGDDIVGHDKVHFISYCMDLFGSVLDWCYPTHAPESEGTIPATCHGKVLGGTAAVDAAVYQRPPKAELDRLQQLGCKGWTAEACLPYYTRTEQSHIAEDTPYHGHRGEIPVYFPPHRNPLSQFVADSASEVGVNKRLDSNNPSTSCGVSPAQVMIKANGIRYSPAKLLSGVKGLSVRTQAHVTRVLFEGKKAVGVEWRDRKGVLHKVTATKEVILSAGVVGSPALLMRSGVGPKEISPTVLEAPAVGKNLKDLVQVPLVYQARQGVSFDDINSHTFTQYIAYALMGKGPVLSGVVDTVMYLCSKVHGVAKSWVDEAEAKEQAKKMSGYKGEGVDHYVTLLPRGGYGRSEFTLRKIDQHLGRFTEAATFLVVPSRNVRPSDDGSGVSLRDDGEVSIAVNYFDSTKDLHPTLPVLRLCRRVGNTHPFRSLITGREAVDVSLLKKTPPNEAANLLYGPVAKRRLKLKGRVTDAEWAKLEGIQKEVDSEEYLSAYAAKHFQAFGGAVGTCSMAPLDTPSGAPLPAVVDPSSLKVVGLESLRVADASILPVPLTAPRTATSLMIGERLASWITGK